MILTLYSGARIRNDYSIVFDCDYDRWGGAPHDTPFQRYLNTLNTQTIEADMYFQDSGSITIEWPAFATFYGGLTYMKVVDTRIETVNDAEKYYFIDSYTWNNGLVTLNYSLDVWHTYSSAMKINDGVISRAKLGLEGKRQTLPIPLESNSALTFTALENLGTKFYLAAEFSVFKLQSDEQIDDSSLRYNYTTLISRRDRDYTITPDNDDTLAIAASPTMASDASFLFTTQQAIDTINQLTAYQGIQPLGKDKLFDADGWAKDIEGVQTQPLVLDKLDIYQNDLTPAYVIENQKDANYKDTRYEIIQFFAIPANFIRLTKFKTSTSDNAKTSLLMLKSYAKSGNNYNAHFVEYQFPQIAGNGATEDWVTMTIPTTRSIKGFGFPSLFIPFEWNNQALKPKVKTVFSPLGLDISLLTDQGYMDVTDQFEVPIPFTTLSATERQLAAISRQQAKRQALAATATLGVQALGTAATVASGLYPAAQALNALGPNISGALATKGGFWKAPLSVKRGAIADAAQQFSQDIGDISKLGMPAAHGAVGLLYAGNQLINAMEKINSPINAGQANNSAPDALINALYGLGTYGVSSIVNLEEVEHAVDRIGMNVFIKTNDYHHDLYADDLEGQYEPIQFATAHVTGAFSNAIGAVLEDILLQGTLISYTPDIYEMI